MAVKQAISARGLGADFDEASYQRLVEHSPMPIAVHIKGNVVFINSAATDLMGFDDPKDLIGRNVMEYVHPDSRELVMQRMAAIYREGKQETDIVQEKLFRKDGQVIHVEIASLLFMYGGQVAIQLILRDITEREKARAALVASEERFRQLADSMPQMVWTSGPDGTADYRNKQWTAAFGLADPNADSRQLYDLIHPDDRDRAAKSWNTAIETGEPMQNELRMRHLRKKTYRWYLSRAVPVKDTEGNVIRWYGTSTDIDDIRRTTQRKKELEHVTTALKEQRAQLVALNHAKDEFISLASHQLRTPATGVKQFLGMTLEGYAGELSTEQRTFLEKAYESNERQIAIVNDLLKVAQVDAGKVELMLEEVDIVELVKSVLHEHGAHFAERQQTVIFKPPHTPMSLQADSSRLRMVLDNIIDNASKYTPATKAITITVKRRAGHAAITVRDEGVGIPAEEIEKIFLKFSRLENPLSAHVGGTGLGLYWARKIVDLHGGSISVESMPGQGSTFTISLPL